jgi:hypothetical protein
MPTFAQGEGELFAVSLENRRLKLQDDFPQNRKRPMPTFSWGRRSG